MLEPCLSKAQIIINVTTHLTTNHTMVTITKYSHRTVVLKGKHQKKNVSDHPSMDSFTKIYIDSEKV